MHHGIRSATCLVGVWLAGGLASAASTAAVSAPATSSSPAVVTGATSIEKKVAGLPKIDGLLPLYWDAREGRLWMEIGRFGADLLYFASLPAGLGSNDVGLDRGEFATPHVVRFERSGPRVLMFEPNLAFRASSADADERRAVDEAFARSVLWGFEVAAQTDSRVLVDATAFALHDAFGVAGVLKRAGQGDYAPAEDRSALSLDGTKGFPGNTEIEATLTWTTQGEPGGRVAEVTPDPTAITLRQRQSLVALPPQPYRSRRADPRAGYSDVEHVDYAAPLGEPMTRRSIARHRLEKGGSLVYYVDRGAPEPIRSALLDGARWWQKAFAEAGFPGAFRVELLPEGADPLDVRYNVIEWVHRRTRGWSYGESIVDPRSGEILKGHVRLGSLRVRQDWLIGEGLLAPYVRGDEHPAAVEEMALARLRQLAAHEVGHTLGLAHNYVASAEGRASVMDYPHPLVKLSADGGLDVSDAYAAGIGPWDEVAIAYGYAAFPPGTDETAALDSLLRDARSRGVTFLTDQDARPEGSAHSRAHLWDNGTDAVDELERVMRVRRVALDRFGERVLRAGRPLAELEEALVPVYLFHRYQLEAAAKLVAGVDYGYPVRGDEVPPTTRVDAARQRRAVDAVLATLDPEVLALPRALVDRIPPRPYLYPSHRELFPRHTGLVFDALSPATVASDLAVALLLHPERAARLVEQHALEPAQPGLAEVLSSLTSQAFAPPPPDPYRALVARAVGRVVADRLMRLASEAPMAQVRAEAEAAADRLAAALETAPGQEAEAAYRRLLARDLRRFLARPAPAAAGTLGPPGVPPGSPIGAARAWIDPVLLADGCEAP